jgi:hypothetical protein
MTRGVTLSAARLGATAGVGLGGHLGRGGVVGKHCRRRVSSLPVALLEVDGAMVSLVTVLEKWDDALARCGGGDDAFRHAVERRRSLLAGTTPRPQLNEANRSASAAHIPTTHIPVGGDSPVVGG